MGGCLFLWVLNRTSSRKKIYIQIPGIVFGGGSNNRSQNMHDTPTESENVN